MTKKITTPRNVETVWEETFPKKNSKKSVSLRKSTQSGRIGKAVLKSEKKKLDIKLKSDVAITCESTVNVTKKSRKPKVVTNAEARIMCPTRDCEQVVIRYRNLFNHFADHCKPKGYKTFRWWCRKCDIPCFWFMGSDLVCHVLGNGAPLSVIISHPGI